ncbi:PAS domain-containing protein [Prosthecobacter fluviatilis]|uniref:PAS domain-containing protein n=1 Tax=Prosthecobacter fluviatilis TaxID=445931 RepID=A0ABW0KN66_9BACT
MTPDKCQKAFSIINQIHALIAYWDADERCVFSNRAYQTWFRKSPEQMTDISMQDLLGPVVYSQNLPHIRAALRGEKQVFERQLTDSGDITRRFVATYTPDVAEGTVRGFSVHATELPAQPHFSEWLPICASCKDVQLSTGQWLPVEDYLFQCSSFNFTHGLCPKCLPRYFPGCTDGGAPC